MAESLIEALSRERPSTTLFHYTSQRGLLGILETKALWASSIHYMSDAAELSHALDWVRVELGLALNREDNGHHDFYRILLERLETLRHVNIFAFSLSEHGDQLGQWRGYCPEGTGYSIGFDYADLRAPMERQGFRLVRCVYRTSEHKTIISELIERAVARLPSASRDQPGYQASLEAASQLFLHGLMFIGPAMKHPSFAEEREWRLMSGPTPNTHPGFRVRPGKSMMIPYLEFKLENPVGRVKISAIRVGPNPNMYLAMKAVTDALTVARAKWGPITPSVVPYRTW
jgi:hypothetical protein